MRFLSGIYTVLWSFLFVTQLSSFATFNGMAQAFVRKTCVLLFPLFFFQKLRDSRMESIDAYIPLIVGESKIRKKEIYTE